MKILGRVISKLKGDQDYHFENALTSYDLILTSSYRLIQLFRGIILRIRIGGKGVIFKGKNVKILYKKYINIKRSCIIEDDVFINALSLKGIKLGENVTIAKGARLVGTGVIRNKGIGIIIGNNSAIGSNSFIGGQGGVQIGNDVIMGPDVKIFSENHNVNMKNMPIRLQGENRSGVIISNNCWIGASSIILDGVVIPEGTVIAAGAVVTKSPLEKNMIVGGVPAKELKSRIS